MVEHAGDPGISALRHASRVHRRSPLALVEVHVEVVGCDDREVEVPVLHLVLAEVLSPRRWRHHERREHDESHPSTHETYPTLALSVTAGASAHNRSSW